jgi:hypothetical protein
MKKKPNDYSEFSAWDDAKFTLGGIAVLLFPVGLLLAVLLLVF